MTQQQPPKRPGLRTPMMTRSAATARRNHPQPNKFNQHAQQNPNYHHHNNRALPKGRANPKESHEKYLNLAKDALMQDDRTVAENYFQHAEHYYRLMGIARALENNARALESNTRSLDNNARGLENNTRVVDNNQRHAYPPQNTQPQKDPSSEHIISTPIILTTPKPPIIPKHAAEPTVSPETAAVVNSTEQPEAAEVVVKIVKKRPRKPVPPVATEKVEETFSLPPLFLQKDLPDLETTSISKALLTKDE